MRAGLNSVAVALVFVLVLSGFESLAVAHPGEAGDVNLALSSRGTVARASGTASGYSIAFVNDGLNSTIWRCKSKTGCWVTLTFAQMETFDEVDLHMEYRTTSISEPHTIASLKIYADINNDGKYASSELVKTVTGNSQDDLVLPIARTQAKSIKISDIVMKSGSGNPSLRELEVYLRDIDGDGLSNGFEMSKVYYQEAAISEVPRSIPDDGTNQTWTSLRLPLWAGQVEGVYANFTVDHPRPEDLGVSLGYWDGTAWRDRYLWSPGGRAPLANLSLTPSGYILGIVTFTATALNGVPLKEARFYWDGALQFTDTDTSDPYMQWVWDTWPVSEAPHSVEVVVIDVDSNAVSRQNPVIVDNTAPSGTLDAPADGAYVQGSTLVRVTASDSNGIRDVRFYLDSETLPRSTVEWPTDGSYLWSWDTTQVPDGPHTLKAVIADVAGNSITRSVSVRIDNLGPSVAIVQPAANAIITGTYTVKVSAADANGVTLVEFLVDDGVRGTDTTPDAEGYFTWSWNTAQDSEGSHVLGARARDPVDHLSGASIPMKTDNLPPTISIASPANGAYVRALIVLKATATDAVGVSYVEFFIDGISKAIVPYPDVYGFYTWNWDTTGYSNGAHTVLAKAYDNALHSASEQISVTVDNALPTVSITSPASGATLSLTVTVSVTASDNVGVDRVDFYVDPLQVATPRGTDATSPYRWSWDTTQYPNGFHVLRATAVDRAGNTRSHDITVKICNGGPCFFGSSASMDAGTDAETSVLIAGTTAIAGTTEASTYSALQFDGSPVTFRIAGMDVRPVPGALGTGSQRTVVVDLLRYIRDLTASENASGILAPNFTAGDFGTFGRWRVVVRDYVPGESGSLLDLRIVIVARTDPLVADSDGDGLSDGVEISYSDLNNDGFINPTTEVTALHSLPIAKDSDNDARRAAPSRSHSWLPRRTSTRSSSPRKPRSSGTRVSSRATESTTPPSSNNRTTGSSGASKPCSWTRGRWSATPAGS